MKKTETSQTQRLISDLTNNEDYQQELWVHYLEGNSPDTFLPFLNRLLIEHKLSHEFKKISTQCNAIIDLLHEFSEFEKSVIICVLLGLSTKDIADYKHISEVRVVQAISAIRYNPFWAKIRKN